MFNFSFSGIHRLIIKLYLKKPHRYRLQSCFCLSGLNADLFFPENVQHFSEQSLICIKCLVFRLVLEVVLEPM